MNTIEHKIHSWSLINPDKIALVDKKIALNYKELFENIWASKILLEIEYGISKGDTVVLVANKNVAFIFIYFALHLIGAKVLPIDEQISQDRLKFAINMTSPKLIIGLQNEINNINARLMNKDFIKHAPKYIVDQDKNKYNNLKNDINKILLTIKNL